MCFLGGTKGGVDLDVTLKGKVDLFLRNFFELNEKNRIDFSEVNSKTRIFLQQNGLTFNWMKEYVINHLNYSHYFEGPSEHHRNPNASVMVFGMELEDILIYVKISIFTHDDQDLKVGYLSFHPCERPMTNFPLKNERDE